MVRKSEKKTTTRSRRRPTISVKAATASSVPGQNPEVSREHVAVRAYHIFLSRGAKPGKEFDDWLQAEQELLVEGFRLGT